MNVAYFDPIGGASGDMIVGALLDAGVNSDKLMDSLSSLGLDEYEIRIEKAAPYRISSTRFQVHTHRHHSKERHHGRHFDDIKKLVSQSNLPEGVKCGAIKVFRTLGEAEAKVHASSLGDIHFHEVGAVDSIVDIVSACIALGMLKVDKIIVGPLPLSHGFVQCDHGEWPVPGPAAMELLKGFKWRTTDIEGELVTPTAAAIFAAFGTSSQKMPEMILKSIGYGVGSNDYGIPNVLRVCIGEDSLTDQEHEDVIVIETSLDDQVPELLDHAMNKLFISGALDVWFTPILMKKNRPATQLTVLTQPENEEKLTNIILSETSTLGVRRYVVKRTCLEREVRSVHITDGDIRVKLGKLPDGTTKAAPEYDDVKAIAEKSGRPAREIYLDALKAVS